MGRLTFELNGKYYLYCGDESADGCEAKECAESCAAVEPCPIEQAAIDKLAAFEDAEEQGKIQPFAFGDTVYAIAECEKIIMSRDDDYEHGTGAVECPFESQCNFEDCDDCNKQIFKTRILGRYLNEIGDCLEIENFVYAAFMFSDIGKTVFLTREAAENALKEG